MASFASTSARSSCGINSADVRRASLGDLGRVGDAGALGPYELPQRYDYVYRRRRHDLEYYLSTAMAVGGPVLEYGVGSGRVALPIARAGLPVTGIDLSSAMIGNLREKLREELPALRRRFSLRLGDMRKVRLRRKFKLITAPFNVVLHLYSYEDFQQFLERVADHLAPGGFFVFDFSRPLVKDLVRSPQRELKAPKFRDPATGQTVYCTERFEYDPIRQILAVWMTHKPERGARVRSVLTHRQYFPQEMAALLQWAGFEAEMTGDFSGEELSPETDTIVVTATKKAKARLPRR